MDKEVECIISDLIDSYNNIIIFKSDFFDIFFKVLKYLQRNKIINIAFCFRKNFLIINGFNEFNIFYHIKFPFYTNENIQSKYVYKWKINESLESCPLISLDVLLKSSSSPDHFQYISFSIDDSSFIIHKLDKENVQRISFDYIEEADYTPSTFELEETLLSIVGDGAKVYSFNPLYILEIKDIFRSENIRIAIKSNLMFMNMKNTVDNISYTNVVLLNTFPDSIVQLYIYWIFRQYLPMDIVKNFIINPQKPSKLSNLHYIDENNDEECFIQTKLFINLLSIYKLVKIAYISLNQWNDEDENNKFKFGGKGEELEFLLIQL
jgi:hypothetical protein